MNELKACAYCRKTFAPARKSREFCSLSCSAFHLHSADGPTEAGLRALRERMFGSGGDFVTEAELLAAWRRDVRDVIEGRRL